MLKESVNLNLNVKILKDYFFTLFFNSKILNLRIISLALFILIYIYLS